MNIANENDDLQATNVLLMIHTADLDANIDDNEQWVEGTPRWIGQNLDRFDHVLNPTTYSRGGDAINVAFTNRSDSNIEWSTVMRCDHTTCNDCFAGTARPGLGKSRGLPFVHASDLYNDAPPGAMETGDGVPFFREGNDQPAEDLVVTSSEKILVNFEHPISSGNIIAVETAVCIAGSCGFCAPASDDDTGMEDTGMEDTGMEDNGGGNNGDDGDEEDDETSRPAGTGPDGDRYMIGAILASRRLPRAPFFQYQIWWLGYLKTEATWETTESAAEGTHIHISNFHAANPTSDRPSLAAAKKNGIEYLLNRPRRPTKRG